MKHLRLYIFIDALGWTLTERYGFCADFLTERQRVTTQLGYSAGAVPTILSGKSPEEHGHFSFFYYDPHHSPFQFFRHFPHKLLSADLFGRHRVRHHLSKILKRVLGYTGYFQLYRVPFHHLPKLNYSEKCDMFVPGGLAPVANLADAWQGKRYLISNWRRPGPENFAEMEQKIAAEEIEFGFLYCAELDGFLHFHIGEPEAIRAELEKYQARIEKLYRLAQEHYDHVEFAVISDHGMTPLSRTIDPRLLFRPFRWGIEYVSVIDSTMARVWFLQPEVCPEIKRRFLSIGHGHWLSSEELKKFQIDFPDHRYGDAIFLLDPGAQFAPSDMGGKPLPGMHGYSPDDPDSDACFLGNYRPGVLPERIADFFRLMTQA